MEILRADAEALARATALLDDGELVVVPTDTRYALAADALHEGALARLFDALRRGADEPLTLCVAGVEDVAHVAVATPVARELAQERWPGPTALVLRAKPWLPDAVTASGETVAVRAPAVEATRALAKHFGPLAIASLPAQDAEGAARAAGAHARLVLDGGQTPGGRHEVVDATGSAAKLLRARA